MSEPHYTELLRKVQEVLVIDLYSHASNISDALLDTLNDPCEGLYSRGSFNPIIRKGVNYYHSGVKKPLTFDEIVETKKNIVNDKGELILEANHYNRNRNTFTTEPPMFSVAMGLCSSIGLKTLDEMSPHFKPSRSDIDYYKFIKPGFEYLVTDSVYDEELHSVAREIIDFVNYDTWNIYFHKLKGNSLIIEKGIDWRIYDWHRIQYEKSNPDSE